MGSVLNIIGNSAKLIANKIKHRRIKGPEFINENTEDNRLEELRSLHNRVGDDQKPIIEREIKLIEVGIAGEKNVIYELKHSKTPMLVLHDITLNDSQIDFLLITKSAIIVLETKKLVGDIEINNDGDFIRYYKNAQGKVYKKEGIYSPITQNKYHVDKVRELLINNKFIKKFPIYSLVVIANPKTIINKTYAKKNIKEKIVKYDQVNDKIEEILNENNDFDFSDDRMYEIADFLARESKDREYNYITKLGLILKDDSQVVEDVKVIDSEEDNQNIVDDNLYEVLRKYRLEKAQELCYRPYMIFNNKELEELVLKRPNTREELLAITGFSDAKVNRYGDDIIKIIQEDVGNKVNDDYEFSSLEVSSLEEELKEFRRVKSIEENIKPYIIYTNQQLQELVDNKPTNKEELLQMNGFGEVKVEKYGDAIIEIIKRSENSD